MQEHDRKRLLERIERDGATVGARIPDSITVDGEPFPLRAAVLDDASADTLNDPSVSGDALARRLRRERSRRVERLETGDLELAAAEDLADEIVGIDRALAALDSPPTTDVEREAEQRAAADRERWFRFLRTALGQDDDRTGARPPPEGPGSR